MVVSWGAVLRLKSLELGESFENLHRGTRVEVTGAQARGQLLSVVLRRIGCLMTMILRGSVDFAMSVDRRVEQLEESLRQETQRRPEHERRKTGEVEEGRSDSCHIGGLEMIDWPLSRPYSSTAAENDNLGDGLIDRYDRSKWGALSPEDATLIFWNRVPWHFGLPNGQVWVSFPARVVRMTRPPKFFLLPRKHILYDTT